MAQFMNKEDDRHNQEQNMQTYNMPDLPIKPELVSAIVKFMQPKNEQ